MARFYCYVKENPISPIELINSIGGTDADHVRERNAVICLQKTLRSWHVQQEIRHLHRSALLIQKTFRGVIGRKLYRSCLQDKVKTMKKIYYDKIATVIQRHWRGFYVRKYLFDYYTRKEYLSALASKNNVFRKQLNEAHEYIEDQKGRKKQQEKSEKQLLEYRKTHYFLSTCVCHGVYNAPNTKSKSLRECQPLSSCERRYIEANKTNLYLRSSVGIPFDVDTIDSLKSRLCPVNEPLPPLRKLQGPFRSPSDVRKQRYKELQPSLRVATDYQSLDQARHVVHQDEWTKRVIGQKFLPSTKIDYPLISSLNASHAHVKVKYGTTHFREDEPEKNIHEKAFRRVVSPISLFENLGKTY